MPGIYHGEELSGGEHRAGVPQHSTPHKPMQDRAERVSVMRSSRCNMRSGGIQLATYGKCLLLADPGSRTTDWLQGKASRDFAAAPGRESRYAIPGY